LIITEVTSVSKEGYGGLNSPKIPTPDEIAGWKNATDKVHAKGGHIYIQLWHLGHQVHSSFHPKTNCIISASNIPMPIDSNAKDSKFRPSNPKTPVPLTMEEIMQVVQDYVQEAKNAKEVGFDGIELHSANGHLTSQMLEESMLYI
jgi:N-ethylmaleimide reductase